MNNFKTIAATLLVSMSSTLTFTSCQDDTVEDKKPDAQSLTRAIADGQGMKKAYGLTYHNFINKNDVMILNADTTEISVNKALAEKMGIVTFVNHPMGIWDDQSHLPYARKATEEKLVGDRYILKVVPATTAELLGENKVTLNTAAYFNPNVQGGQTRAGIEMPDYAAKYIDENDIIHPATVLLTDPYGYEKGYHTDEDQPTAGTRADGSYQFITGEELASGTRFSANRNILSYNNKLEKVVKLPCGKDGEGKLTLKAPVNFELNYFLTLNGGWSWQKFSPYIKEFETGLDGKFGIAPEVKLELHKEWKLDPNKFKKEIVAFDSYSFTFMIGIIPVVVQCKPNLYARIDGKVDADFKAGFKYEYQSKFKGGIRYTQKDGWSVINDFKEEKNTFTLDKPKAEVHAEAGIAFYMGLDVLVYGAAGPTASIGPRLGTKADLTVAPWNKEALDLKAKVELGINAEIGAKLTVLGYDLAEVHKTFQLGGPWTIWQYPSTGNEHQVGKNYTPEEEAWNRLATYVNAAQALDKNCSLWKMIDEMADIRSQMERISKDEARSRIINACLHPILCHGGDRYFNAGGKLKFLRNLKQHYTYYTREWYSPRGRAWTELKNILLDNDQVKAVAAAHPVKIEMDNIFNMVYTEFKAKNNNRLPEMNQADMQQLVDLVVSIGKNYRLR